MGLQSSIGRDLTNKSGPHSAHDWDNVLDLPPFLRQATSGTTSEQIRSYYPTSVVLSDMKLGYEFLQQLNSFSENLLQTAQEALDERSFYTKMINFTGIGLSAALLGWLLRSGTLLASLLATLPAWRNFDPVAILGMNKKEQESLAKKMQDEAELESRENQELSQVLGSKTVNPSSSSPTSGKPFS